MQTFTPPGLFFLVGFGLFGVITKALTDVSWQVGEKYLSCSSSVTEKYTVWIYLSNKDAIVGSA